MSPSSRSLCLLLIAYGVLSTTGPALPVESDKSAAPQLTITSQTMTAQGKQKKALFDGAVVLTQGDLIIHSDHMVVSFNNAKVPSTQTSEQGGFGKKIEKVVATGNVVIEKSAGKATCGRAVYYKEEEKVVLTESPVACQNGTRVTGLRMTMYLNEDRSVVEGESRVTIEDECSQ